MSGEDAQDIRATLDGDGEAYARIVERYQQKVAGRLWRFTRDVRELEELVQDTFVEAYRSLKTYRSQAPLLHWLMRIATRVGYRFWKRRDRRRAVLPLDEIDGAVLDERDSPQQAGEALHALLSPLRPRDRLVLTLLYGEGLSVAEAAEQTGWSESMVKVQAHRARKRLRAKLDRHDRRKRQSGEEP